MKLTAADVLDLAALSDSRLVAGRSGLERAVSGVRLWAGPQPPPDAAEKLLFRRIDEFGPDVQAILEGARIAARERASALFCIRSPGDAGWRPSSEETVALDALRLPVFDVPWPGPVLEHLHRLESELLERVIDVIQRADLIHRELTLVAITGGDLQALTEKLAELIQNPVGLRNLQFDVLSDAPGSGQVDEARLRSVREGRVPVDVVQALEQHGFQRRLRTERGPFRVPAIPEVGLRVRVLAPILIGEARYGYISIAECARPLGALDMVAVEKAALVAALILSHQQESAKNDRRLRASLAHELIFGANDRDAAYLLDRRARLLGYSGEHFAVFAIGLDLLDRLLADPLASERQLDLLLDQVAIEIDRPRPGGRHTVRPLVLTERDGVIVLQPVQPERPGSGAGWVAELRQSAAELAGRIARLIGEDSVWIGIARPRPRSEARRSYREARLALTTGRLLGNAIAVYEDLGLYQLLAESADPVTLHAFAQVQLGVLLAYDAERKGDLVRTLRLYLESGGSKVKTASRLPSHLNTVKYRLQQIADLTGHDPDDPEQQLSYRVALKILDLQG